MPFSFSRSVMVIALTGLFFARCSSDKETRPQPDITSFAPEHGLPGSSVTITGLNFSSALTDNEVTFNGVSATVTSATETQLTVTVPDGSATGKIAVNIAGQEDISVNDFEVLKDFPRNGLIAFYPFNGNANDASGNDLHGTVNGPVSAEDRFGKTGQAYSFDGVDDYIDMGNPQLLQITGTITVAGWININAFKEGNLLMALITKIYFDPDKGGNPTKGYWLYQNYTGGDVPYVSAVAYSATGLGVSNYVGEVVTTDTWIFMTLVIDGTSWRYYHDGVKTDGVTGSANVLEDGTLGDLNIGRYGGGFYAQCRMDDIMIYNRALTDDEVTALYEQTATKYP